MINYRTILRLVNELTSNGMSHEHAIQLVSNSYGVPYSVVYELIEGHK